VDEVVMIGKALASPIESIKGIYSLAKGGFGQDPSIQSTPEDRANFMALSDYYKNKYGDWGGFKQAMIDEPASILSDASMVLGGGAGLAAKAPKLAKLAKGARIASRIDPINIAYQSAAVPGRLLGRTQIPEKMWTSVAKPLKKFEGEGARIFEEAAKQKVIPTQKGLLGAGGASATPELWREPYTEVTQRMSPASQPGVGIQAREVFERGPWERAKELEKVVGSEPKLNALETATQRFVDAQGESFTPGDLLEIKRATGRDLGNIPWDKKASPMIEARKSIEDGIQRSLEKLDPRIKELNKDVQTRKMLNEVVQDAAFRIGKNNIFGLGDYLAGAGGGAGAAALMATGRNAEAIALAGILAARGILSTPRVKSRLAIAMRRGAEYPIEKIPGANKMATVRSLMREDEEINNDNY
jgi:hypothetical protein